VVPMAQMEHPYAEKQRAASSAASRSSDMIIILNFNVVRPFF
jgi:hypothetical protein